MSNLLAEYGDPEALLAAVNALRARGYRQLEAYTPFPVPGLDAALGHAPSRLPWAVFAAWITGAAGAYGLQWLLNAYLYPLDVGSRPPHFPLSYVPITFEMGILLAGFTALFGVLWLGRLYRLWQPIFETPGFTSATRDGFWLEITSADPRFDAERTRRELDESGARRIETQPRSDAQVPS
jgi:hypothetical protein